MCGGRLAWLRSLIVPLALLAFAVYSVYSISRADQLLAAGYDLGIFDQAVRAYSQFRPPLSPLKGDDFNLLGDHFHPILTVPRGGVAGIIRGGNASLWLFAAGLAFFVETVVRRRDFGVSLRGRSLLPGRGGGGVDRRSKCTCAARTLIGATSAVTGRHRMYGARTMQSPLTVPFALDAALSSWRRAARSQWPKSH